MSTSERPVGEGIVLLDRAFDVVELDGAPVLDGRRPQLAFGADGRLSGQATINRVFGSFELAEGILRIGPMGSTMMAGPPESMAQEHRLLTLLGEPLTISSGGDAGEVLLAGGSGTVVLRETEGEQL